MTAHLIVKHLHDKGSHAAVYANEEVDAGEDHVSRAGHVEHERCRVHHGSDGPAGNGRTRFNQRAEGSALRSDV